MKATRPGQECLTDRVRLDNMNRFLATGPLGVIVEAGVYRGGSLMALAMANPGRSCYGFDTFCGLPPVGEHDPVYEAGDFPSDYELVCERFRAVDNVILTRGVYPRSDVILPHPVALAHVDVDIYDSTIDACRHLAKFMTEGGRLYCDDAGIPEASGATLAFIEFAVEYGRKVRFDTPDANGLPHWYISW